MNLSKAIIIQLCVFLIFWLLFTLNESAFAYATRSPKALYSTLTLIVPNDLSKVVVHAYDYSAFDGLVAWTLHRLQSPSWRRQLRILDGALRPGPVVAGVIIQNIAGVLEVYRNAMAILNSLNQGVVEYTDRGTWRLSFGVLCLSLGHSKENFLLAGLLVFTVPCLIWLLSGMIVMAIQPRNTMSDARRVSISACDISGAYIWSIMLALVLVCAATYEIASRYAIILRHPSAFYRRFEQRHIAAEADILRQSLREDDQRRQRRHEYVMYLSKIARFLER